MKHLSALFVSLILSFICAGAFVPPTWEASAGLDAVYDMSVKPETPAPKGYKAVYVSHYGRHGSRYPYTSKAVTIPMNLLSAAKENGNLTPRGEKLLADLQQYWKKGQYTIGELTPLGWAQHSFIAKTMVESFPAAFGKGSRVDACSSPAVRSVLSMSSECATISREAPNSSVYAHQGVLDIQAAVPNHGPENPFRYKGPETVYPYSESLEDYFNRKVTCYRDILSRIFINPDGCLGNRTPCRFFHYYHMLIGGMNSIPEQERIDTKGLVTPEEYAILWDVFNYEAFLEYLKYRTACCSIVDDIIAKADIRLSQGEPGADLRFGHDHVVMPLLMIMDVNGFGTFPATLDSLSEVFQTFHSPMAANLQFVFYTSRKGEPLVKLLLNGAEAEIGTVEPVQGPYYRWEDVKAFLNERTSLFVYR